MAGLIDHIFENIVIEQLSRSEIESYNKYILEIFYQNLTVEQRARLLQIQTRLKKRMLELDK
ncbi:hypothetical protein HUW51_05675 [Adhaeribacter swui]|uniref:Uncharacterized protein n=1 Tax=Adhaeribacter swui TaxID=2086471 RepID=A0A7G7G510_9BACT|nr:hypothetical protein [Adhaeribacter swui]QNF32244.1 hypothetical protein HUW51_05675 [Adhaeribacter swui]